MSQPKFQKGAAVLHAQGDNRQPVRRKIVSGPHQTGNCPECYVVSGQPGMVPAELLEADKPADTTPASEQAHEVIGTVNADPAMPPAPLT